MERLMEPSGSQSSPPIVRHPGRHRNDYHRSPAFHCLQSYHQINRMKKDRHRSDPIDQIQVHGCEHNSPSLSHTDFQSCRCGSLKFSNFPLGLYNVVLLLLILSLSWPVALSTETGAPSSSADIDQSLVSGTVASPNDLSKDAQSNSAKSAVLSEQLQSLEESTWSSSVASAELGSGVSEALGSDPHAADQVAILWGCPDVGVTVGQLFEYRIPQDAFTGRIQSIHVKDATGDSLPDWLSWDAAERTLVGVPGAGDLGPLNVMVSAVGEPFNDTHVALARDVFTIFVREESPVKLSGAAQAANKGIVCDTTTPTLYMTLNLDVDLSRLLPTDRKELIVRASKAFSSSMDSAKDEDMKSVEMLANNLRLVSSAHVRSLHRSVVVGGVLPRKEKEPQALPVSDDSAVLMWRIGCGETLEEDHGDAPKIVDEIENSMESGYIEKDLGFKVLSWSVQSVMIQPRRRKRQYRYFTPTPVPSQVDIWSIRETTVDHRLLPTPPPSATVRPEPTRTTAAERNLFPVEPTRIAKPEDANRPRTRRPDPTSSTRRTTTTSRSWTVAPIIEPSTTTLPFPAGPGTVFSEDEYDEPKVTPDLPEPHQPPPIPPRRPSDEPPVLRSSMGIIECHRGIVCTYQVPIETFLDAEDGDTRHLKLSLSPIGDTLLGDSSWLQFDAGNQTMRGLTMDAGDYQYRLNAMDSNHQRNSDAFVIKVLPPPVQPDKVFTHSIKATVSAELDKFRRDHARQFKFVDKLSQFYGDSDASFIILRTLRPGSVIIEWSNSTLMVDQSTIAAAEGDPTAVCPRSALRSVERKIFKSDGTMRPKFRSYMEPDFVIQSLSSVHTGPCAPKIVPPKTNLDGDSPLGATGDAKDVAVPVDGSPGAETGSEGAGKSPTSPEAKPKDQDDMVITTIVPIVVICVLLLVATIIACVLWKKNRKAKTASPDHDRARSAFVSKGSPVILIEELGEEREPTATTPMLLKDEQPPLPVPDYSSGPQPIVPSHGRHGTPPSGPASNGRPTGHHSSSGSPFNRSSPGHHEMSERSGGGGSIAAGMLPPGSTISSAGYNPTYQPPPSIEASTPTGGRDGRSPRPIHPTGSSRQPPPYVPP